MNQIADVFNNLRNANFVLPRFKTVTGLWKTFSQISGTTIVVKIKQGGERLYIGTFETFRTVIREKDVTSFLDGCGGWMPLLLRLTGRTQIYLFISASELIYAFSFYIVNLELSFKVLTKKFNLVLKCKRVCFNCSLSVKSMKFGMMIVFKALKKIGYGAIAKKSIKCEK